MGGGEGAQLDLVGCVAQDWINLCRATNVAEVLSSCLAHDGTAPERSGKEVQNLWP